MVHASTLLAPSQELVCTGTSLLKAPPSPLNFWYECLEQNLLTLPFGTVNVQPYG